MTVPGRSLPSRHSVPVFQKAAARHQDADAPRISLEPAIRRITHRGLLGHLQRIVQVDTEISDRALKLSVPNGARKLDLRATHRVASTLRDHPLLAYCRSLDRTGRDPG